jgi:hypothetical protein
MLQELIPQAVQELLGFMNSALFNSEKKSDFGTVLFSFLFGTWKTPSLRGCSRSSVSGTSGTSV